MASVTFLAQEILGTEDLPDYQAGSRTLSTETSIKRSPQRQMTKSPKRMFEKSQADARRLRIKRVAAMSISVSEVRTLYP